MHVHVYCAEGEAKFWLEPEVALARNYGLSQRQVVEAMHLVEDRKDDIAAAGGEHFRR